MDLKLGASKLGSFCYGERSQYLDIAKENEGPAKIFCDMAHEVAAQQARTPAANK